jgi:hypothetical protein
MKRLSAAALLLAASVATPVFAQELTEEQQLEATQFAINNSTFVLQHEIGHLFVAEFGLPVLGKEEDAADNLASVTLLQRGTEEAQQALIDSADGWYLSEYSKESDTYESSDFYDEHSLDIQRSYTIVCLMVGADPETFGEVAEQYEIDEERQEGCGFDYQQQSDSWGQLLEPNLANGGESGKIEVIYEEPSEDWAGIAETLKDQRFLETAAEELETTYALPRDLTFKATECGEENAFYSYDEAAVTFCYEMVAMFFNLVADDMLSGEGEAETE